MPNRQIKLLPPNKPHPFSRRFVLTLLTLILAPFLAYAAWALYAQHQLTASLRAIRAAGEPIDVEDFRTPTPAPGRNAADDLLAAGRLLDTDDLDWREFDRLWLGSPLTPKETALLTRLVAHRRAALAHLEAAAAKPDVHWDIDLTIDSFHRLLPGLTEARAAANLLRADALLAHQQGDDARALARVDQALDLARICDAQPAIVSHLVATGIAAMATGIVRDIAPDLRVDPPAGLPRARLRAMIDRLLDDRSLQAGMRRALCGERYDAAAWPIDPKSGPAAARIAAKPFFTLNANLRTRILTAVLHAYNQSTDWPTFRDTYDPAAQFPELARHPDFYLLAGAAGTNSDKRYILNYYRALADLRLAATLLALRCYAADHAGQPPATLDALVPTYLPAIPTDPMLKGRAPLHYRADPTDPRLYSVGDDTTDDHGSDAPSAAYLARHSGNGIARMAPPDNWTFDADDAPPTDWDCRDTVYHLTRQPRYQPQGQLEWQHQPLPD
jgi:hypothetical protein